MERCERSPWNGLYPEETLRSTRLGRQTALDFRKYLLHGAIPWNLKGAVFMRKF
jgi:hypothetical protein